MNKTIRHPATGVRHHSARACGDVQRSTTDQITNRYQAIASLDSILAKKVLDDSPAKTEKTRSKGQEPSAPKYKPENRSFCRDRRAGDKNARRIS